MKCTALGKTAIYLEKQRKKCGRVLNYELPQIKSQPFSIATLLFSVEIHKIQEEEEDGSLAS
jgi:hypothetical protein